MSSMHTFFSHINDSGHSDFPLPRGSTTSSSPDDTSSDSPEWNDDKVEVFTQEMDIPKVEEIEENILSIKPAEVGDSAAPAAVPRKRGRPRKHPLPTGAKVTKGRSKTGCITCRRRKKKCDETKPA
jgi:hypothetical protein